jgi:uncharacterized protein (DUF169 family)
MSSIKMTPIKRDLSIFDKFNFERKPVAVKYMLKKPDGIAKLNKPLALCEMLREAQAGIHFYAKKEDFECVGPFLLGMVEPDALFESGQVGPRLGVFEEPRTNRRLYQYVPMLQKNTVNCVAFSPLDKLSFNPDVLVISANPSQAEIILRATSYVTGKVWHSKLTSVMGCAWIFIYPYLSGELNYHVTNLVHGMKGRQVLPDGVFVISIPFDLLGSITENLKHIDWVLPEYIQDRDTNARHFDELIRTLGKESSTT